MREGMLEIDIWERGTGSDVSHCRKNNKQYIYNNKK